MFGTEGAVQVLHHILDRLDHGVIEAVTGGVDGEVHIAIAQMADRQGFAARIKAGQAGVDAVVEFGNHVQRQGDVGVDGGLAGHGDFGGQFAAFPHGQALGVVLGNFGVQHGAFFDHLGQGRLQQGHHGQGAIGAGFGIAGGGGADFDEDVGIIAAVKGQADVGAVFGQAAHIGAGHILERLDLTTAGSLKAVQQGQGVGQGPRGKGGGGIGAGAGDQFHHGGGDDAQRPLGPDEKLAQIIARVVLVQFGHQVQDAAIGQNHLEPQTQGPGAAIAQHVRAAGIGGQNAADHGRPARAKPQGEVEALPLGRLVQALQDDASLDNRDAGGGAQFADAVQAFDRQHQPAIGHGAAGQAGQARDGDDGHLVAGGDLDHLGHLLGAGRADDGKGGAGVMCGPVSGIAVKVGPGQDMGGPQKRGQFGKQGHFSVSRRAITWGPRSAMTRATPAALGWMASACI